MPKKHGPWTVNETVEVYRAKLLEVWEDRVLRPDGQPGTYSTVHITPGVAVLPVEPDGTVYLTKQFRYALGQESVEAVTGAVDEGEKPERAAARELREELGLLAEELISLGTVDLDTSIVRCPVSLYLARRLKFQEAEQDETEQIKLVRSTLTEAVGMVMRSDITHGPSCALILKAGNRAGSPSRPAAAL